MFLPNMMFTPNMGAFALPRPPFAWQVFWSKQDRMRRLSRESVAPELKAKAAAKRYRKASRWVYELELTRLCRIKRRLERERNSRIARYLRAYEGGQ